MRAFVSDLDNTLIYSYKRDIGERKKPVELYNGRHISFMSEKSFEALKKILEKVTFIPLSTRSVEQYKRINFGRSCTPEFALVSNGGILLKDGKIDEKFKNDTIKIIKNSYSELENAKYVLSKDKDVFFEIRLVDDLFVFTKSKNSGATLDKLRNSLDLSKAEVFSNGEKVYVLPKLLDKGMAVRRVREYLDISHVFSAGDSLFDIPMLNEADVSFVPWGLEESLINNGCLYRSEKGELFSDFLLEKLYKML
ncbi:HAD hydrolase family protein [Lachnospiraceae bacterium NSJ-143]|nr:HAD hydrolase family protein [Lachnospiraceae bacterium NSJ-143]